jgi:hypothetical protein
MSLLPSLDTPDSYELRSVINNYLFYDYLSVKQISLAQYGMLGMKFFFFKSSSVQYLW